MSLNPLYELKRRLDDDKTPLPKRLCLAKNVVHSYHFPTAPKERIVAEWLQTLAQNNSIKSDQLKCILDWLSSVDDLTNELKSNLIRVVSQYLKQNPLQTTDVQFILLFLENSKISPQLSLQIDDYLSIVITLLQSLQYMDSMVQMTVRIMNNMLKYYRESKRKLDFIIKILNGENIETIFYYLDTDCRHSAIEVCQNILFPINKKIYFISFLQTLIRKDNIEELIAEKGDNIQSVIKIMNTFFEFPKNRSNNDPNFLYKFIDVFVSSFKQENQVIFAFYIMVTNVLRMEQNFITPAMNLVPILNENDIKTKRNLFLNMLETLLNNEIDINVRLTDTFGEKISKVEIKKNFTTFLQAVMMGQIKLKGKLDKTTLQIIKIALKLDPILIEQKQSIILPAIMSVKKNSASTMESYIEMMNCLLQILFKLSRGTLFITDILPYIKNILEASNTEQFELKQKVKAKENGIDYENMESKILYGSDLFPQDCVLMYGKLTSELMFRQNKELLESLEKDLEIYCLMMLEEGFVSPSIIVLTEVLSDLLCSFLNYNKMVDHTVPMNIADDFWNTYKKFEEESLSKFGQCILKLNYNPQLVQAFLKLCQSFGQLKLLNLKYSNVKLNISYPTDTMELFDISNFLPCLNKEQWMALAAKIEDNDAVLLDSLLLTKVMAMQLMTTQNNNDNAEDTITAKGYLVKKINTNPILLQNNYFCKLLFLELDKSQTKQLAKCLIKLHLANPESDIFKIAAVTNNRELLNSLVMETAKNITKCFEKKDFFSKALGKSDFDMVHLAKEIDFVDYFYHINIKQNVEDEIKSHVNIFKQLQIYYLDENYQLVAIFLMLTIKKYSSVKKLKRTIDTLLQSIYELSLQQPDLYQLFPVESIFSFQENTLLDLLTLKLKNSNNLLIIRSLLELAVKKVRVDSQLVKTIVENILKINKLHITDINSFSDPVFQISCLILPLIVKQKKTITASAFRSILADLQEKLYKILLESFKNINFNSTSIINTENSDNNIVETDSTVATLNAMAAFSISLSKCCETTASEEIKNLDCLWSGLEFFVQSAIKSIENPESKSCHIDSSIQLFNVTLRHIKKLGTHNIFVEKDKLLLQIYSSVKCRLSHEHSKKIMASCGLEELGVTLKFICELSSVECFGNHLIGDLASLVVLKKPCQITIEEDNAIIKSRKVFNYLWSQCLKANIVGPKCVAMSKFMHRICKNLKNWIRQHFIEDGVATSNISIFTENYIQAKIIKIDDVVCEMIKLDLDSLCELILAAKKVSLDYKFVDSIFELQHLVSCILCNRSDVSCDVSWDSFVILYDACVAVLNSLIMAREEILEDRWPCYMQCYRTLVTSLCERATSHVPLDRTIEERLATIAHHVEKLTQSVSKRKKHVSRIAPYTVADICTQLEVNAPTKLVRQHLENCVALLIQASDSSYAVPFLKRALAGSPGQMTMTNLYTMYKRYHKYVGNA